ncbi:MAG: excinuclease ABC subunit UvrA [Gracilimonas sp.]|uniref:excinuclease ABC subunit UvrA n=1 Tax=Gracilimonas TaxID=649462 RepID=UPI001B29DC82|nr:excinuclease ABC subunit UvrA [Gracilimonas sp.]MBO6584829.1 excinuclease ABC subunit UvrA [Gracilimonas sp.]MBO6615900.1 excinuclease ABC subunit UvrA [Gracilimonas sp.]
MSTIQTASKEAKEKEEERPIIIKGARTHNLKDIDVEIPRNKLTVVTGVSGSGKSSLAFDTIYAEGQRRYVESLSSYARQFLERMDKPDVDFMQGISPAMAIQQKTTTSNPRSTVGTTTEIYDYVRLLFARIGKTISPVSGEVVKKDTPRTAIEKLFESQDEGERFYVLHPIPQHEKKKLDEELKVLKEKGLTRLLNIEDESMVDLTTDEVNLKKFKADKHRVLIDRLVLKDDKDTRTRIADSLETAFQEGSGRCSIKMRGGEELRFSERFEKDGIEFTEPTPQMFSFNNPFGACDNCEGFGKVSGIDEDLVIPDHQKTIRNGAIAPFDSQKFSMHLRDLIKVAAREKYPIDTPYAELSKEFKDVIWKGKDEYIGIWKFFDEIKNQSYKVHMRVLYSRYRGYSRCQECEGYRVRKDALYVKVGDLHVGEVSELTIGHARDYFEDLELTEFEEGVAGQILYEIRKRLKYLDEVGLDYLTLDRLANTLSGGESQRISLANALGSSLIGSLYVLDEPTIGLHPRDNDRLIKILESLRDIGNTVLVVEHDPEMIKAADNVIDIGPFAGTHGGEVVFQGSVDKLVNADTLTGKFLSGRKEIPVPQKRRKGNGKTIELRGASEHNLKNVDVDFPLGMMTVVTGVSGSGKSTLVHDTLYAGIQKHIGSYNDKVGRFSDLSGMAAVHGVEMVDQSPIGRSSRSNPATYTKAFDGIRDLFANTKQSKIMGYEPGHFSFNVPGGRCENCQGEGVQRIEMQFMADIELTCEVCNGTRFRKDVLSVKYRGKNIHDVLEMPVSEAIEFFVDETTIINKLQPLEDVGLGYLKLGQSATTLSGGEAQRVKLAKFLAKTSTDHTLYFFDEPTTGLHFEDVAKLLDSFNELVEQGHSVIIIEHNLDIIKCADWIIDIGPEGGFGGGQIVAEGTPEDIMKQEESYTGKFLKEYLG